MISQVERGKVWIVLNDPPETDNDHRDAMLSLSRLPRNYCCFDCVQIDL